MARRRAQAVKRGRPTAPRGPRGSQASSKSPRARAMASKSPRGRSMARMSPRQRAAMVRSNNARARGPQGPRGPMGGAQLSNRNRMQNQMQAAAMANMAQASQGGKGGSLFGTMGNVQQRPIPNRDGRMANMAKAKADIARAQKLRGQRPQFISMDPSKGTFGKAFDPRPMPQSNYMRQPMSPQKSRDAMSRGPMPRANIGSVQAPQPNFNKQIKQSPRGRRGRITP